MTTLAPDPAAPVRVEPLLRGRIDTLRHLAALSRRGAGLLVVAGRPGCGATRCAREAAGLIAGANGMVVRAGRGDATPALRVSAALAAASLGVGSGLSSSAHVVVLVGDLRDDEALEPPSGEFIPSGCITLIATARSVRTGNSGVYLPLLDPDDARAVVVEVAPALNDACIAEIVHVSQGLPGRLVLLARAAADASPGTRPVLPEKLAAEAQCLFAGIPEPAHEVARWAAILGDPFDLDALRALVGRGPADVEHALAALVENGVIAARDGDLRFCDPLVPAALVHEMPASDRRRRSAEALAAGRARGTESAALVAYAVRARDVRAVVELSLEASAAARLGGDAGSALSHAERAILWCVDLGDDGLRLRAHVEHGTALADSGEWVEGAEVLERAAAELRARGDENAAIAAWSEAATAKWRAGDLDGALSLVTDTALAVPATPATNEGRASALTRAAIFSNMLGRYSLGTSLAQQARESCRAAGLDEESTRALIFLAQSRLGMGRHEGFRDLSVAMAEAEGGAGRRNETLVAICESHFLLPYGRPAESAEVARRGIARAQELGLVDHELVLRQNLAQALMCLGDLPEAGRQLESASRGWRKLGQRDRLYSDVDSAWLALASGDLERSLLDFHSLTAFSGAAHMPFDQGLLAMSGHALAAAALGETDEAYEVVAAGLGAWRQTNDVVHVATFLAVGSEVGRDADARACGSALSSLGRRGHAVSSALSVAAEGHLSDRVAPGTGIDHLRRAADRLDAYGMSWWAARCLLLAGSRSSSNAAADVLLAARRRFASMPAPGWRARCEAGLRAMGRRFSNREKPASDANGLTPRETEVLRLVQWGLRNREIGERLFISERTVARHLLNIFAKLGINSRSAAARVARETMFGDQPDLATADGTGRSHKSGVVVLSPRED